MRADYAGFFGSPEWRIELDAARIDASLKLCGHALGGHEPT
jgi:hypothetical protein